MPTLEAGRELDALVAEKAMGYHRATANEPYWNSLAIWVDERGERREQIAEYSTDIAAAWQVVERLGLSLMRSANGWVAGILEDDFPDNGFIDCGITHVALAETAPLAICRAALAATGYTDIPSHPPA